MLDRIKAPKAVEKEVKELPDANNTRFGTVVVDPDEDPKLVKFYLNKPISGMAKRLVKTLKGTGFTKVQILLEDGTSVEGAADEEDGAAAAPEAAAPPSAAQAPAQDAVALGKQLAALIPRVAQVGDAARKAELAKLANLCNTNLKTNNLTDAATYIEQLRKQLDDGAGAPSAAPVAAAAPPNLEALHNFLMRLTLKIPEAAAGDQALHGQWSAMSEQAAGLLRGGGDPAAAAAAVEKLRVAMAAALEKLQDAARAAGTYDKSGKIWAAVRQKVEADLGKLRASILDAYKGQPFVGEIEAKFTERTAPVLRTLDLGLADKLAEVSKTADKAKRSQLIDQAHDMIDGYRAYASAPLLGDLDANPFVPLSVQATVTATLDTLAKALH